MKITHRSNILRQTQSRGCILKLLALVLALSSYSASIRCEQLSTVFILETSDSESTGVQGAETVPKVVNKPSLNDNTQIITDETISQPSVNSKPQVTEPKIINNSQQKQSVKPQQSQSESNNQRNLSSEDNPDYTNDGPNTRDTHAEVRLKENKPTNQNVRIIEETSAKPQTRQRASSTPPPRSNNQNQQPQNPNNASVNQQRIRSTSASPSDQDQANTTPKSEERLLISITQDDDYYKPPKVITGSGSTGSGYNGEENPAQIPKRKPAITISIQDGNFNKQNGGSSSSALIVNGQSIVISTIGGASLETGSNSNSFVNDKPTVSVARPPHVEPNHHNTHQHHNNHNNQNPPVSNHNPRPPQREPIDGPINSGLDLNPPYMSSSTTFRPQQNNDYVNNPSNSNQRPVSSGPIEPPRPQISDERPHRPVVVPISDLVSEDQKRPTSRPINRPPATSEPVIPNDQIPEESSSSKYPLNERNCGLVHETKIVGGEEANPDDFLWMAAIVKSKPSTGEVRPFCGGSLITRRHILTAAHCLENLAPRDVLVRLGSYDFDDSTASSLSADYAIDQFRVPSQYSKKTHVADIAIMRLKTPLSLNDNYKTVCMAQPRRSYVGALGTVTGYGSQSQTFRRAAPKLRQVTVPIWENRKCSIVYKKNLTDSFMCAGYEEGGKDACQGDSGGPLMTEGPNERMMVVGVVSHGIGCGAPGYPGVYTRTSTFLEWIEKNTRE